MMAANAPSPLRQSLVDPFGRTIDYVRVSVTDRCDFRCVYCMAEDMAFLPKRDLLTLEELDRLCSAFIARGVRKLRLTGGEPLVRRDVMTLIRSLARHLESGALHELTLTTNGSQLARYARELASCGVRRINVSLDTLDPNRFRALTRWGDFDKVMAGLDAAQAGPHAVEDRVARAAQHEAPSIAAAHTRRAPRKPSEAPQRVLDFLVEQPRRLGPILTPPGDCRQQLACRASGEPHAEPPPWNTVDSRHRVPVHPCASRRRRRRIFALRDLPHPRQDLVRCDQVVTLHGAIGVGDRVVEPRELLGRQLDLAFIEAVDQALYQLGTLVRRELEHLLEHGLDRHDRSVPHETPAAAWSVRRRRSRRAAARAIERGAPPLLAYAA